MTRLIDADALLESFKKAGIWYDTYPARQLITNAPTVETQKQWVELSDEQVEELVETQAKLKEINHD